MFVEWCNICQSAPATGLLTGHFVDLEDEPVTLNACTDCAKKSMKTS